ncbi:DUF1642 domain-containing protein [Streptococcus ruminicola]|uniref:DUF1642 domain-containing protein n=1 Tax=Streptococcus ruminicola TaxID=2686210 RepID=A0A6G8HXT8_9STRE|nr:DUF1642 domain-containing protein [Streptococcus ruminicola]QIM45679.1 DUF1642 domain-containing protein [Streptococcus ruminicola]
MNKQEAVKGIKNKEILGLTTSYEDKRYNEGLITALSYIEQIDEPEKPVVPQFVADYIEENRDALEEYVFTNVSVTLPVIPADDPMHKWLNNKGIGVIVDSIRNGYEVKKEKLYTVKFANEDFGKIYIGIFKKFNKLGISSLPLNDDEVKSWFTEDELKRFKFWDNPAFEVKEVK